MKTAKQWDHELWNILEPDMGSAQTESLIRDIQVDALKQAADIVNQARFSGSADLRSMISEILGLVK